MADNLNVTPGSGAAVRADELGDASLVQFVKIMDGNNAASGVVGISGSGLCVSVVGTPTVTAANVTIASITTGTVSIAGVVGTVSTVSTLLGTIAISGTVTDQIPLYVPAAAIASGTGAGGVMFIGVQSGATNARAVLLTTTGSPIVTVAGAVTITGTDLTIASITTGTMNVATGLINISGTVPVTLASLATVSTLLGTVAISGSASIINTPVVTATVSVMPIVVVTASANPIVVSVSGTGNTTIAGTPTFIQVNYATLWNAYVVATTSAAGGIIVKTSGAHTLYVTDLVVAATGPNDVSILSETTAGGPVAYLATKGGFVYNARTPFVCVTAQSLRVVLASSGSVTVFAAGYTVT